MEICQNERFQRVEIYQTADISTNTEISIDCLDIATQIGNRSKYVEKKIIVKSCVHATLQPALFVHHTVTFSIIFFLKVILGHLRVYKNILSD